MSRPRLAREQIQRSQLPGNCWCPLVSGCGGSIPGALVSVAPFAFVAAYGAAFDECSVTVSVSLSCSARDGVATVEEPFLTQL